MSHLLLIGFTSALILLGFIWKTRKNTRQSNPPGPHGVPLLGNLLQLSRNAWVEFTAMNEKFGPIVYLTLAGQPVVVLGSQDVVVDLLDRKAKIYSDRPRNIVACDTLTGGMVFAFARYGDVWRRMRRAAHEALNNATVHKFYSFQATEAVILVENLLKTPDIWDKHMKRAAASLTMSMIYGFAPLKSSNDPSIAQVNDFVERLVKAAYPGNHLVEFLPWLRHLPAWMAKWKREALYWFAEDTKMFQEHFETAKSQSKSLGTKSFAATIAENQAELEVSDREAAWLSATLYAAGAETTAAGMEWFMLAMVLYPEVQAAAQKQLDEVVGRSRLPSFSDFERLPYIRALVMETLRWHPVTPIGVPHTNLEDDWYQGYFIPKGTICIPNVWAINHDPETYGKDANKFNPNRFLESNGQLAASIPDTKGEGHASYGFGGRICVGRHVANRSLFIKMASILWACNIRSDDALPPSPDNIINNGLAVRPDHFKCTVTPRYPESLSIVEDTKELLGIQSSES